ncbi:MAG: 13E12 repeat family protein [Chryseoglobus sp.]|nr:DUF222 domain-containing protein [Microcella sp.]MBX9472699.1 13E12 repeat family protein [Microcella sp.]
MTSSLLGSLDAALHALLESADEAAHSLDDSALLEALDRAATVRRLVDARSAVLAGEVAWRSTPQLAHSGLAQRRGHRTPEELVRVTTGASRHDARIAVRAGSMLATTTADDASSSGEPALPVWARALIDPVKQGRLSTAALESVRSGLGDVSETVSAAALHDAVMQLLAEIDTLDVDRLHRRARQLRDELDTAGIAEREAARRHARSLRVHRGADGMTRATWLLDPESAAIVTELYDRATSPRRGGPTFLAPDDVALIDRMRADDRSPDQYASDVFLDLLRVGAAADSSQLLSTGAPSVRVVVTARDVREGSGAGEIEGQTEVVSLPTVLRLLCGGSQTPILISSTGQPLDVGRAQRLFTVRQRIALAVRDGGCRWAGCERPPSWCEVGLPGFDGHRDSDLLVAGRCSHGSGVFAGVQGSSRRALPARSNVQGPREGVRPVGHDHLELGESGRQEICAAATRGAAGIG